jgi:hypothetical protein
MGGAEDLRGGNGREVLNGGTGGDTIEAGKGNDKASGGKGNDWINGGEGNDVLVGGLGDDWLGGGAGDDKLDGGDGSDTIVAIDGTATDVIAPGEGTDYVWRDFAGFGGDAVDGTTEGDFVNDVDEFDNEGADLTLDGDRIPLPETANGDVFETFTDRPLFSSAGPDVFDINQGALGDCYFLAGLGAAVESNQDAIRSRVVDFGDGTYGVHLGEFFYRVDNRLVVARYGNAQLNYVSFGAEGSVWASVMEKAFCHFRVDGADSYPSIEGGFSFDVLNAVFESPDSQQIFFNEMGSVLTESQMTAIIIEMMSRDPDTGELLYAPTLGFDFVTPGIPLLAAHQYVVLDYDLDGYTGLVSSVTLYNPWGIDGVPDMFLPADTNPNDGIVVITLPELIGGTAGSFEFGTVV